MYLRAKNINSNRTGFKNTSEIVEPSLRHEQEMFDVFTQPTNFGKLCGLKWRRMKTNSYRNKTPDTSTEKSTWITTDCSRCSTSFERSETELQSLLDGILL